MNEEGSRKERQEAKNAKEERLCFTFFASWRPLREPLKTLRN
jgi:hypothetical protein